MIIVVALAAIYGIYKLFFYEETEEMITGTTVRSSITTTIEGSATTTPSSFQMLSAPVDGTIVEVYVSQGDTVEVGELLYEIDSSEVESDIEDLEATITDYQNELSDYYENIANLTIDAIFGQTP